MIEATVSWHKHKLVFQHEKLDHIARYHRAGVLYEKALIDFVFKLALERPKGVFIDVGAHVGNHAIAWAKSDAFACGVAFESNAQTFEHLCANVVRNEVDGIEDGVFCMPFHVGASMREVRCDVVDPSPDNTGMRSIREHSAGAQAVQMFALDDLPPPLPSPPRGLATLVKIDVEGAEFAVLQGARRFLREHRPIIVIESSASPEDVLVELPPDYHHVGTFNATPTHVFVSA